MLKKLLILAGTGTAIYKAYTKGYQHGMEREERFKAQLEKQRLHSAISRIEMEERWRTSQLDILRTCCKKEELK